MSLLLIGSSHVNKTHRAPPRYKISDFFSSLLDPFCGVGTTLIETRANGYESAGFEVNHFAAFIAKTKLGSWLPADFKKLDAVISAIRTAKPKRAFTAPANETVVSYYDP